jgi:outer membrane protein assembly factor BamB
VVTTDTLEALDAASGEATWRVPLPAPAVGAPAVTGDAVLVALESGDVVAAAVRDGTVRWRAALGHRPRGPVSAQPEGHLLALDDGRIVRLAPEDGHMLWEQRLDRPATAVTGWRDRVYVGSLDNFFYCLDARNGRIRWRWRTGADVVGLAVVDSDRVYFVSLDNLARALDRNTGVQRWKGPLAARPIAGPLLVGDTLLLSSLSPELQGTRIRDGESAGRYDLGSELGAPPAVAAGAWPAEDLVVAITNEGNLLILGRRLSFGVAPMPILPGTAFDTTAPPPPQ